MLRMAETDATLGVETAFWVIQLADGGHRLQLAKLRDRMTLTPELQSLDHARVRVLLALALEDTDAAILDMRIGADAAADVSAWWLWCTRWAEHFENRDVAMLAWSTLATLVQPGSSADLAVRWHLLRHKLNDAATDPYLQINAPTTVAFEALRFQLDQFAKQQPEAMRPFVEWAWVRELVDRGWTPDQVKRFAARLKGGRESSWPLALGPSMDEESSDAWSGIWDLRHGGWVQRGAAWRRLWSKSRRDATSVETLWQRLCGDDVWGPIADPWAAFTIAFDLRAPRVEPMAAGKSGQDRAGSNVPSPN